MKTWFISDTHFGHANILNFKDNEGRPLRDFSSCEEMDETMVKNWNAVVSPEDKVYHLGDVAINKKNLSILDRLNGRKTLICGNHDIFDTKIYNKYFKNIRAYRVFPEHRLIFSHIPVHTSQVERRFEYNIHGHTHSNYVTLPSGERDLRYINICVEKTNYTPVNFDDLLEELCWDKNLRRYLTLEEKLNRQQI